jgi:methyltransferase (TIGR00027 family)
MRDNSPVLPIADPAGGPSVPWNLTGAPGQAALLVAVARAVHSTSGRPLIDDPFAVAFVRAARPAGLLPTSTQEAEQRFAQEPIWLDSATYIGVRTRVFDDFCAQATADGVRQVVILGAGLDARAHRLDWPDGTTVYEVDQANVLRFKESALAEFDGTSSARRRAVPMDLRGDWSRALVAAGFDPARPSAWLTEGLLPFLPPEAQRDLFDAVHKLSAPGSHWAIEQTTSLAAMRANPGYAEVAKSNGLDPRPLLHADERPLAAHALRTLGWTVTVEPANAAASRLGQPIGRLARTLADLNEFVLAARPVPNPAADRGDPARIVVTAPA